MKHPLIKRIGDAIEAARQEMGISEDPDLLLVSPEILTAIKNLAFEPVDDSGSVFSGSSKLMSIQLIEVNDKGADYMVAAYSQD